MEEFIYLRQGGISVQENPLKFTKFSKYALSLVPNPTDEMSHCMMGVSEDLVEKWHLTILHENIDISRLIVHVQ